MKLHQIKIRHCAPKDCKESLVCYAIANDEVKIMEYIDKELLSGIWNDRHEEDGVFKIYDDDHNIIGAGRYKEKMMKLRGEFNDPAADYSDKYYGLTHYGWDEGKEITEEESAMLLKLEIAIDLR